MRKSITIILLLTAVFLSLFSCGGSFLEPYVNNMRDGGFGPNPDSVNNPVFVNPDDGKPLNLSGDITITPNSGVTIGTELTAVYSGSEEVSYQWKKDGTNVGGNSNKYTPTEAGSYTVTVSASGYNPKTSAVVDVSDPSLLNLSGTIIITPDINVTARTELTAVYNGNEEVSYQWKKDGINVGGNSNKYTPTEAGSYTVTVSVSGYNSITSPAVNVVVEYAVKIDILDHDHDSGDTITVSPDKGIEGDKITLNYTVAKTAHYNQLELGGVNAAIAPVESAESGTRTYIINAEDSSNEIITITAVFTHTDLIIDNIEFEDTEGHITKTYGDAAFTNAITEAHHGNGAIIYNSSDEDVAVVNDSGLVTIFKPGSTIISAEKVADEIYAHALTAYTLTVNPKLLTITGLSATNKIYDGTTTATVTGTPVINGKVGNDTVTITLGTASFASAAVGNNKTIIFSNWSLGGSDAANYTLSAQSAAVTANITAKPVTITGLSAANKNYDGTTTAAVTGTAVINGKVSSDTVSVTRGTASFASKTPGNNKTVTFSGFSLTGADAGNYTLSAQPLAVKANITVKPVTITGLSAANKNYDGTTKATVTGTAVISGLVSGETVTVIAGTASFANADVGNNKTVTFSGYSLTGTDVANYTLSAQPAAVTANIIGSTLSGNITISPNSNVIVGTELTAVYSGSESVSYQWRKNGVAVGSNSSKFTPTEAGSYTVTVSAAGYTGKTSAAVTVTANILNNTLSGNINISPNTGVIVGTELTAVYSGSEAVSYQWKKDGANVGTNSNKYTPTSAGNYTVTVSASGYNSKTSAAVTVTAGNTNPSGNIVVNLTGMDEWTLIEQPVQTTANEEIGFTVNGSYTAYKWYLDGEPVGTSSTYTFKQPADVYQLVVVVTNSSGEKRSGRCRITVNN